MTTPRYASLIEQFRHWAAEEPSIRSALVVGSQARSSAPADEWSDLDLVIFHEDPDRLIESTEWFQRFGAVVVSLIEPTALLGSRERRVLYSDGRDVDFSVFPAAWQALVAQTPEGASVLRRGYEIVLDKDGHLARVPPSLSGQSPNRQGLPSEEEFQSLVADFWYHFLWTARKLRRGELWTAKMGCDGYLKRLLARIVEWQTIASSPGVVDTWHEGRFLDAWADPEVRARLPRAFATYDSGDVARALRETGELFSEEARAVARKAGWPYPTMAEAAVRELTSKALGPPGGAIA
jgi:aminoglycoside 6-adenylyltransferase